MGREETIMKLTYKDMEVLIMIEKIKNRLEEKILYYPSGISTNEASILSKQCKELFGVEIPSEYVNFLQEINGFSCCGRTVYGFPNDEIKNKHKYLIKNDFIYRNDDLRGDSEDAENYLLLGGTSLTYIAMNVHNRKFVLLSEVLDIDEEYDSFNDMFEEFLGLNNDDDDDE
jgi:hypothetical protein